VDFKKIKGASSNSLTSMMGIAIAEWGFEMQAEVSSSA
jgi:hypothetical protein